MAKPDFLRKRGDTLPAVRITLLNPDKTPYDPTGDTLTLFYQDVDEDPETGTKYVGAGTFTVVSGPDGEVDYNLDPTDTDTIGSYRAEVEAKPTGGGRATFPSGAYILFDIVPDLGDA